MKANYELTTLVYKDMDQEEFMTNLEKALIDFGIEVKRIENLGKKRLAYEIKNQTEANYYVYHIFIKNRESADKLARYININKYVMRYLMIMKDTNHLED